jgi:hypothetical protein
MLKTNAHNSQRSFKKQKKKKKDREKTKRTNIPEKIQHASTESGKKKK